LPGISERKISDYIVKIEKTTCISSKNCITVAPELFELDENRICEFVEEKNDVSKEKIIEACSVCPVSALYVYNIDEKQLVP